MSDPIFRDETEDTYAIVDVAPSGRLDVVFSEVTPHRTEELLTFHAGDGQRKDLVKWFRAIADEIERNK